MTKARSRLPVLLVVDDQPEQFAALLERAEKYRDGCLRREFDWHHVDCYQSLRDWYRDNPGRFVSLIIQDVDFGRLPSDRPLLDFPATGLRPVADDLDLRAFQGFVIYHQLRAAGLDRLVPVVFNSTDTALDHGREIAEFIVYPGQGTCSFVTDPASGHDKLDEILAAADNEALRPLDEARRRHWREHHRMAVGGSRRMAALCREIERLGPTEGTVLLLGEPGAGKELCANALHRCSSRHDHADERRRYPLAVNMVALDRNLVLAELFGHVRGAYTGAVSDRAGLLETAGGSTVFLDEIGEIDTELQQKLLRVLENRRVRRLGSAVETEVDIRIICATNRSIEDIQRHFRWDFYTRVVQQTLNVPSLSERWSREPAHVITEDIEELIAFTTAEAERTPRGLRPLDVDSTAVRFLASLVQQYLEGQNRLFAGEMRTLRGLIERARERAHYDGATRIGMGQLAFAVTRLQTLGPQPPCTTPPAGACIERAFGTLDLERLERVAIAEALAKTHNNQTRAAELLGIHRDTLRNKIHQYGLS